MKTEYISFDEINPLQTRIMLFIQDWVKTKKTPVPQKEVVSQMKREGFREPTILLSLNSLLKRYYIRKACTGAQNRTFYIQLRTI